MFGQMMDMEPVNFDNVDLNDIRHQISSENRLDIDFKFGRREKQTSIPDLVCSIVN
jgi:hypothetical protein